MDGLAATMNGRKKRVPNRMANIAPFHFAHPYNLVAIVDI
jgi:hypothetical protein